MEGNDVHVCDSRRGLVMFDPVQLPSSEKVVNGLALLLDLSRLGIPKPAIGLTISEIGPPTCTPNPKPHLP